MCNGDADNAHREVHCLHLTLEKLRSIATTKVEAGSWAELLGQLGRYNLKSRVLTNAEF